MSEPATIGPEFGCLADREHDDVGGEVGVVLGELRREAALRVEHRQAALQPHAGHDLPSSTRTSLGPHEQFAMTPSSSASSISHGCAGSSSIDSSDDRVDFGGADAQRDARAVDRDVAAADHQHALALDAGVVLPVARAQELERADHALGVCAGQRQDAALLESGGDEHGVVLADEVVDGHVVADRHVEPQVHAHRDQVVDLVRAGRRAAAGTPGHRSTARRRAGGPSRRRARRSPSA